MLLLCARTRAAAARPTTNVAADVQQASAVLYLADHISHKSLGALAPRANEHSGGGLVARGRLAQRRMTPLISRPCLPPRVALPLLLPLLLRTRVPSPPPQPPLADATRVAPRSRASQQPPHEGAFNDWSGQERREPAHGGGAHYPKPNVIALRARRVASSLVLCRRHWHARRARRSHFGPLIARPGLEWLRADEARSRVERPSRGCDMRPIYRISGIACRLGPFSVLR